MNPTTPLIIANLHTGRIRKGNGTPPVLCYNGFVKALLIFTVVILISMGLFMPVIMGILYLLFSGFIIVMAFAEN